MEYIARKVGAMTREEAIKILKAIRVYECYPKSASEETKEAIDMAIGALSAERTGEWIDKGEYAECSMCGAHSGTQFDGVEPVPRKTSFCPDCGADMRREK